MSTYNDTFPRHLTEIDDLTRPDHSWLDPTDQCLFLGEYTARKGSSFSATNQTVLNFKKSVDRRGRAEWCYKERAIADVAQAFGAAIDVSWLTATTLVPIPPSKAKGHPLHDDRMVRMLRAIPAACPLDIRELIIQQQSMEAAHNADVRPTPEDIAACYCIDETLAKPKPNTITLLDDVMTTGAHYVAARRVLASRFSEVTIVGLFIARRVPETTDFSAFFGNSDEG
jgi:hypothetical protein